MQLRTILIKQLVKKWKAYFWEWCDLYIYAESLKTYLMDEISHCIDKKKISYLKCNIRKQLFAEAGVNHNGNINTALKLIDKTS